MEPTPRSYAVLTDEHLERLAKLARRDWHSFTESCPEYKGRYLGSVLAQGAALHYLDGKNGVKDLDVWTFFAAIPDGAGGYRRFPADKRHTTADSKIAELGRQAYDLRDATSAYMRGRYRTWMAYEGRRVDLLLRSAPVEPGTNLRTALDAWLTRGTTSARLLAMKPIIAIAPAGLRGKVLHDPR